MLASLRLFDVPISPQLALALVLVAASTLQYNLPPEWLRPLPAEEEEEELRGASNDPEATKLISSDEPNDDSARGSDLGGESGALGHGLGSSAASTQAAARNLPKR